MSANGYSHPIFGLQFLEYAIPPLIAPRQLSLYSNI